MPTAPLRTPRRLRAVAALLPLIAIAAAPPPVDIAARLSDGRRLNFLCAGHGAPTILLESGWSADSRAWPRVMKPLAERHRVCAYDRAGSGRSSPGPLPRNGAAIARDLDAGLRAARIGGPFVLVGHSAGALYLRHFILRRPREIRGVVFVDGMVEGQAARFAARFGAGAGSLAPVVRLAERCLAAARAGTIRAPADGPADRCAATPPESAPDLWTARLSEARALDDPAPIDRAGRSLATLPLIVIVAGKTYGGSARDYWIELHAAQAALSTRGELRVADDSGHLVMRDRPDLIVRAVGDILAGAAPPP